MRKYETGDIYDMLKEGRENKQSFLEQSLEKRYQLRWTLARHKAKRVGCKAI